MATFFTDEIFSCSCGNLLFEEIELKSYIRTGDVLRQNTYSKVIKCKQCGKEITIDENNEIIKQA